MIRKTAASIGTTSTTKVKKLPILIRRSMERPTTSTKMVRCSMAGMRMTATLTTQVQKTKVGELSLSGCGLRNPVTMRTIWMMMMIWKQFLIVLKMTTATMKVGTGSSLPVKHIMIQARRKSTANTICSTSTVRCCTSGSMAKLLNRVPTHSLMVTLLRANQLQPA